MMHGKLRAGEPMHLRLDQATLERLDRFAGRFTLPGRPPTKTDLVRGVLLVGLEALEAEARKKG